MARQVPASTCPVAVDQPLRRSHHLHHRPGGERVPQQPDPTCVCGSAWPPAVGQPTGTELIVLASKPTGWARAAVLGPALIVGLCAVTATAHGGYEVAVASRVPAGLTSALYPAITDGLALVAYAATHRLTGAARAYAWSVVVASAGLSGLAQAIYLVTGPGLIAPPGMRFGVGAWPAVAGAVAAHLVFLLAQKRAVVSPAQPVGVLVAARQSLPVAPPVVTPVPTPAPDVDPSVAVERPKLRIAPASKPTAPSVRASVDPDAEGKARDLAAAGVGRTIIKRETGVKDHVAQRIVREAKAAKAETNA